MADGLWEAIGEGFKGMGAVASHAVAQQQAEERSNLLPNMIRSLQITRAQRELDADKQFADKVRDRVRPGMTSSALLEAVKDVDPALLATSPTAQTYLQYAGQVQQREQTVERERQRLQATLDRLNRPTEHVVNGKLVRSYADGRTETVDLGEAGGGGSVRYSISPKDYTPASLKKYAESRNVGDLVPIKTADSAPSGASFDKTGEEFLATLPAEDRTFVKKLTKYEIDPKTLSTRGGQREKYLKLASQYDQSFDQKEYNTRYNAINKFATGPQGNVARNLNVAIEHMDTARKLFGALNNGNIPLFNSIANEFARQTGKPAPDSFEAVRDILADEVTKGVIGGAGALADREGMAKKVRAAASPAALEGVLSGWTELLGGQLKGLEKQYEGATKRTDFRQRFITPRALKAMGGDEGGKEDPLGIR